LYVFGSHSPFPPSLLWRSPPRVTTAVYRATDKKGQMADASRALRSGVEHTNLVVPTEA
jgi:hypothetical protein